MSELTDDFKKSKLYFMLQALDIKKAILRLKDSTVLEYDYNDEGKFKLSEHNTSQEFTLEQKQNTCPVCGKKIIFSDTELLDNTFLQDYHCKACGFRGTQWLALTFIGHTSSIENHTILSYKKHTNN